MSGPDPSPARAPLATLASHLLDRVDAAVVVVDLQGVVLYANPYCELLYGRRPEDMIGQHSEDFAFAPISTELRAEIGSALQSGRSWEGDFTVLRRDDTKLEVHAFDSPVFDENGAMSGVISLAFDATYQHRAQDQLRRIMGVAEILRDIGETVLTGLDDQRVIQTVTDAGRRLTGASVGVFVQCDVDDATGWAIRTTSGREQGALVGDVVAPDALLLRDALAGVNPTRFDDLTLDAHLSRALDALLRPQGASLRSGLIAPVRSRAGEVVGAIVVAHPESDRFSEDDEHTLVNVAAHAGMVLDIARLFRAAEREIEARRRAEEVQRFYAETSAVLSWSLDLPETFKGVARLCVPFLADLCLIDVAEDSAMRRVAAVHADPSRADLVEQLIDIAPDAFGVHPAASVVRGGKSEFAASMTDELLRATTRNDKHYRIVKELGFSSYMCVPLTARGRTIGALTLVSAGSGRRFDETDLVVAEELGRRAALAIDNARLFSERDYVARALQSSLLPPSLPAIPGVHFSARYQAAGEGNEVGGDFYDVFQGGRNAWWFVVGDVSGKGPQAAAIAGLARHTLHAVALERRAPRRLLAALHETLAHGEGQGEYCTVCCALLRPGQAGAPARMSIACGGHPPPIIRRADRSIEIATCSGPLLGVPLRESRFIQQTLTLDPGDSVVLYTDGVTEAHRRNQPLFGEERLADVIAAADDDVDKIADSIVAAVREYGPPEPRDDLAVVVVQIDEDGQVHSRGSVRQPGRSHPEASI